MVDLVETLHRFNRKERSWLIQDAVGETAAKLSDSFRGRLEEAIRKKNPDFTLPEKAVWLMDFHLDWLIAAIRLHTTSAAHANGKAYNNSNDEVTGTQQDIDLSVAFDNTLILVEAKGVRSWGNNELSSKIERLDLLSEFSKGPIRVDGTTSSGLRLFLVLCSPTPPKRIDFKNWPKWGKDGNEKPLWFKLRTPHDRGEFDVVTRLKSNKTWTIKTKKRRKSGEPE
jgi:hypothetical protein